MAKLHAGLDVADRSTVICIVDETGEIVLETVSETTPESIGAALKPFRRSLKNVGQESGLKAAWLHRELVKAKFPMRCLDAYKAHALLGTRLNKTDANDALGLARLLAKNLYVQAHIKSPEAIELRVILSLRQSLQRKANDLSRAIKSANKQLGEAPIKPKRHKSAAKSDVRLNLEDALRETASAMDELLTRHTRIDRTVTQMAKDDPLACRLMTVPGVGPITALTFIGAIDDPLQFASSRLVPAYFGLTPRVFQSGETTRSGRISHRGDSTARKALVAAARSMIVKSRSDCRMRRWAVSLARRKGYKLAYVACARKLAVLMHHLWVTGEDFDPAR